MSNYTLVGIGKLMFVNKVQVIQTAYLFRGT